LRKKPNKLQLVAMVDELRCSRDEVRRTTLAGFLTKKFPGVDVVNLCASDLPSDELVDFCLDFFKAVRTLTRDELIHVIEAIRKPEGTSEAEDMLLVEAFVRNCRHPAGTDLIFYPDEVFGEGIEPTAEMIADKAMGAG